MKTKVVYSPSVDQLHEYHGADEIQIQHKKIIILEKGKVVAIECPQRRGTDWETKSAWVVKEPKKRWKLKLVKE